MKILRIIAQVFIDYFASSPRSIREDAYHSAHRGHGLHEGAKDLPKPQKPKHIPPASTIEKNRGCTCLESRTNSDGTVRLLHMSDCALVKKEDQ